MGVGRGGRRAKPPSWIFIHDTSNMLLKVEGGLLVLFLGLGFSIVPPLPLPLKKFLPTPLYAHKLKSQKAHKTVTNLKYGQLVILFDFSYLANARLGQTNTISVSSRARLSERSKSKFSSYIAFTFSPFVVPKTRVLSV